MKLYIYVQSRKDELKVVSVKVLQIAINIVLFVCLRASNNQKTTQTYGLTAQKQLLQAQQISSMLQNYNFGPYYSEYIRAFITIYLASSIFGLIHAQIVKVSKQFSWSFLGALVVIGFLVLDLLIVTDYILLSSEQSNLSQAANEIYVDSYKKSKDSMQFMEITIRQFININKQSIQLWVRFLTFFFQGKTLWADGIKPFLKKKRIERPLEAKPVQKIVQPLIQKSVSVPKRQASPEKVQKKKKVEKPAKKQVIKQPELIKQISASREEFNTSTQAESQGTKFVPNIRRSFRSESLQHPRIIQQSYRYNSQQKKEDPQGQKQFVVPEQLYQFSLETNCGKYDFKATSINDFNNKLAKIAQENSWNTLLTLNVKLNYWNEAYQIQRTSIIKEELQKVIAQYAYHIMSNQSQE
ncbi:hypothetical protein pb186bvf_002782 [Paramecium bursaria]